MRISVDPTDRRIHTVVPQYVLDCVSAGKRLDIRKWKKKQLFRGLYARFGGDAVEFEDLWIARGGIIGDGGYAFLSGVILQQPPTDRDLDVRYITDCIADRCLLPTDDYVYRTIRLFSGMSVWWHSNNAVARVAFSALGGRALVDDEIREEMLGAYQCIVLDGEETPQIASARAAGATVVPSTWVSDCIRNGRVLPPGLKDSSRAIISTKGPISEEFFEEQLLSAPLSKGRFSKSPPGTRVVQSLVAPREQNRGRKRRQWEPLYSDDDEDEDDDENDEDGDDDDPKGTYDTINLPEEHILARRVRAYGNQGLCARRGKLYCTICKQYINAIRTDTCTAHVLSNKHNKK